MSIDMIVPTPSADETFWKYNYPVALYREKETGAVGHLFYRPRKEDCVATGEDIEGGEQPHVPAGEVDQFIENAINKFKTAIALFEAFRDGHIDEVCYWDLER